MFDEVPGVEVRSVGVRFLVGEGGRGSTRCETSDSPDGLRAAGANEAGAAGA